MAPEDASEGGNPVFKGALVVPLEEIAEKLSQKTEDDTVQADIRHDEIVLDHALAKSSNVASPVDGEGTWTGNTQSVGDVEPMDASSSAADNNNNNNNMSPTPPIPINTQSEVIDLEDDFFSMSYRPQFTDAKKKKKKKKKVKSMSGTPSASSDKNASRAPVEQVDMNGATVLLSDGEDDSLIELNTGGEAASQKETIKEVSRIKRPITPPPMDEAMFKKMYKEQHQSYGEENDDFVFSKPDLDDSLQKRLALLDKITANALAPMQKVDSIEASGTGSPIDNVAEPRKFQLHITSFLPGSEELQTLSLNVKGNKTFGSIIRKVLAHYLSQNVIPEIYLDLYEESSVTLYWNKMKVMSFMKLDSLGIPEYEAEEEETEVTMALYSRQQAEQIEEIERLDRQSRQEQQKKDEEVERLLKENQETQELQEVDEDLTDSPGIQTAVGRQQSNDNSEYFKIGLKGEDNSKVIFEVAPHTKIIDIIKHYLKAKELPETTKVKLVFDDEDLDISGTIADTELEEDFTVDVYIES